MGNSKSKTVTITSEPSEKDQIVEGTGKVEKIEEADYIKPGNNDDGASAEIKKDTAASDNKDTAIENKDELAQEKKEATIQVANEVEKTVPQIEEDEKKVKKEKVKKKFSFRAFSFNKKDKQKPEKGKDNEKSTDENNQTEAKTSVSVESPVKTVEEVKEEIVVAKPIENPAPSAENSIADKPLKTDNIEEKQKIDVEESTKTTEDEIVKEALMNKNDTPVALEASVKVEENTTTDILVKETENIEKQLDAEKTNVEEAVPSSESTNIQSVIPVTQSDTEKSIEVEKTNSDIEDKTEKESMEVHLTETKEHDKVIEESSTQSLDSEPITTSVSVEATEIPPLPEIPPPPQVMAFADSVISKIDENASIVSNAADTIACEVVSQAQEKQVEQAVPENKILETDQLSCEQIESPNQNKTKDTEECSINDQQELVAPLSNTIEQILEQASDAVEKVIISNSEEPKPELIEKTIAILDEINKDILPSDESSDNLPIHPPTDLVDTASKQESLDESLPSPPNSQLSHSDTSPLPLPPDSVELSKAIIENVSKDEEIIQDLPEQQQSIDDNKVVTENGTKQTNGTHENGLNEAEKNNTHNGDSNHSEEDTLPIKANINSNLSATTEVTAE